MCSRVQIAGDADNIQHNGAIMMTLVCLSVQIFKQDDVSDHILSHFWLDMEGEADHVIGIWDTMKERASLWAGITAAGYNDGEVDQSQHFGDTVMALVSIGAWAMSTDAVDDVSDHKLTHIWRDMDGKAEHVIPIWDTMKEKASLWAGITATGNNDGEVDHSQHFDDTVIALVSIGA